MRKAVIPAAGMGTRLRPLTDSQPKEMVACGRAPVMGHVLEELRASGITQVILISRAGKPELEEFVHSAWPGACIVRQAEPRGLGDAVAVARPWVGDESFVVANGDTIIHSLSGIPPLQRMIETLPAADGSVVMVREVETEKLGLYGVVEPAAGPQPGVDRPLRLAGIIEKPSPASAPSRLAVAGRYLFSPAVFGALQRVQPDARGEIQLTEAIRILCCSPGGMYASPLCPGERRFDIGNFESYFEAFASLASEPGNPL